MPKKPARTGKTNNKAKVARRGFKSKTSNFKADHQSAVCTTFVEDTTATSAEQTTASGQSGALANTAPVADGGAISIAACIPLHANANILQSNRHATLKQMFNEYNTSAVYLDLLFSPELRKNCDQVFMLVERGIVGTPGSVSQMVSDVNCRMYQLGDNTQKLSFQKVFSTAQDRINKKTADTTIEKTETYYLKILCTGKNTSGAELAVGDCQIKLRAKCFNKYRDMKALSAALN
jgi:hypothetical protein